MNILTKLVTLMCVFSASAFSMESSACFEKPFRLEAKAGYFFFASKKMRDVYSNGGYEVQLSGSYPIKGPLHVYGGVGFIHTRGKSKYFHENTAFWQIPVDLGLKGIVPITSCVDWFIAAGPRYFHVHQHNDSNFVRRKVIKNGFGLFINTGIDFFLTQCFYANFFGEYSYEPLRPPSFAGEEHARHFQVGGYTFGAGIGYLF